MPHTNHNDKTNLKQPQHHTPRPQKAKDQKLAGKEGKDKTKIPAAKGGEVAAPAPSGQPRPWSKWFAGDGGRWFYQARPKVDGSGWEYQFTEGYPSVTRRQGNAQYGTQPSQATPVFGVAPIRGPAVNTVPVAPRGQKSENVAPADNGTKGENDGGHEEETPPLVQEVPQPWAPDPNPEEGQEGQLPPPDPLGIPVPGAATRRPALKASIGGNTRGKKSGKAGGGHKKQKKLNVVVKAEKDLKFNPKSKVKGWLSAVDA